VCVSLSRRHDILFNMYYLFIDIELTAKNTPDVSTITLVAWMRFIWQIFFFCKEHQSLLICDNNRQIFTCTCRAFLKKWFLEDKKCEKHDTSYSVNRVLVYIMRTEMKSRHSSHQTSTRNMHDYFFATSACTCPQITMQHS
jgi:hypothetical protein